MEIRLQGIERYSHHNPLGKQPKPENIYLVSFFSFFFSLFFSSSTEQSWDPKYISKAVELTEDCRAAQAIKANSCSGHVVLGKRGYSKGIHAWRVTIFNGLGSGDIRIGVARFERREKKKKKKNPFL
jgi:hypothetical protein